MKESWFWTVLDGACASVMLVLFTSLLIITEYQVVWS
jgi:hypothetical protein